MRKHINITAAILAALMTFCTANIIKCLSAENAVQHESQPAAVALNVKEYEEVNLPYADGTDTSAKAYMDFRTITDTTSTQHGLIHESGLIEVEDGFLMYGDYIGVAMGSYFGRIGETYRITLDTGLTFDVIKVEEKADADTDRHHIRDAAGGIIEFVIDTESKFMQENVMSNGYVFHGDFNNCDKFAGNIIKIEREI